MNADEKIKWKQIYEQHCKDRNPWERIPGEQNKPFAYFNQFKNMEPLKRSLKAFAEMMGVGYATLSTPSQKYSWIKRSQAWDMHLMKIFDDSRIKAIKQMNADQATQARALRNVLMAPVKKLMKEINKAERIGKDAFDGLKPDELLNGTLQVARVLPAVADMERKARGEPNNIDKVNVDHTSGGEPLPPPSINIIVKGTRSPMMQEDNNNSDSDSLFPEDTD